MIWIIWLYGTEQNIQIVQQTLYLIQFFVFCFQFWALYSKCNVLFYWHCHFHDFSVLFFLFLTSHLFFSFSSSAFFVFSCLADFLSSAFFYSLLFSSLLLLSISVFFFLFFWKIRWIGNMWVKQESNSRLVTRTAWE